MGILITFILIFSTGILKFLNLYLPSELLNSLAGNLSSLHDWSGLFLGGLVSIHLIIHLKWLYQMTKRITTLKWDKRTLNYLIDLGLLISFLLNFITGIIKTPFFPIFRDILYSNSVVLMIIHDWSGIILSSLSIMHVILHWKWFVAMTKRVIMRARLRKVRNIILWTSSVALIASFIFIPLYFLTIPNDNPENQVHLVSFEPLSFNPEEIETVRPDLFVEGHYSIFDILVNLDNAGKIDMDYYFDPSMDTFVIDSINDAPYWWYTAYYHGGWQETNVFRMDHYPYKPRMYIKLFEVTATRVNRIYNTFREEITRKNNNNGSVVVPLVRITTPSNTHDFENVLISAHNLRNDTFQEGVITAIDVIMSLGDSGLITYRLQWYEEIGQAEVRSYWVDEINGHSAYGRCGFVYEAGDYDYYRFNGNHIHIPSDIRIITSPEYVEYFWICI